MVAITKPDATNTNKGEINMDKILNTLVDGNELTNKHKELLLALINTIRRGGYQHENQNKYS
jgi:hypothetical protein